MVTRKTKKNVLLGVLFSLIGIAVVIALLSLAVWMGGSEKQYRLPSSAAQTPASQEAAPPKGLEKELMPLDLNGKWTGTMKAVTFDVSVVDSTITIKMVSNNSNMLYWYGSFPQQGVAGDTVKSDKLDIDKAVMSRAPSKDFVLVGNTMTFEVTAMGNTTTVEVTHV